MKLEWTKDHRTKCGSFRLQKIQWTRSKVRWFLEDLRFADPASSHGSVYRRGQHEQMSYAKMAAQRIVDLGSRYSKFQVSDDCFSATRGGRKGVHWLFPCSCPLCHSQVTSPPIERLTLTTKCVYQCGGEYAHDPQLDGNVWVGSCQHMVLCEVLGFPYWTPIGVVQDLAKERGLVAH